MADIYLLIEGQQNGPYPEEDVRQYLAEGRIQGDMLAWREGMAEWVAVSGVLSETSVPVDAPVASEVPHSRFLTAEARSASTWKCPTCAEEIQKDAKKCRFCGMILTEAAKMGYPAFYENVVKNGLSFTSLLFDYGDFLYADEEGVNDCCLGAPNMLASLFNHRNEDEKAKVLRMAGGIVKAMKERLSDIPAESQEALTIKAGCKFLWMVRDFAEPGDPINDPDTLHVAISHFTELRQTLSPIEPEDRQDLEKHIDYAIEACQGQLKPTGRNCSEPSSTEPRPLQTQDTPSGTGSELSGLPKELTLDLGSKSGLRAIIGSRVELELVLIPAGKFVMGSPLHEEGRNELEDPLDVTISQPYYMGKYPVTQEQYKKIMGQNFSVFKGRYNPAERVSWNDASEFCRRLSAMTGKTLRLPTMAEWEYACRAGTTTRFCSGDSDSDLNSVGWYVENSGQTTHPVGQKAPNAWGLYDMHGNVYEWCEDVSGGRDFFGSGSVTDPKGPIGLDAHAVRGGCWGSSANECRSSAGMECASDPRNNILGFRVVVDTRPQKLDGTEQVNRADDCGSDFREKVTVAVVRQPSIPPPTEEMDPASVQERNTLIRRIIINVLFLIPYIVLLSSAPTVGGKPGASMWMVLPILIWGFIGFRWVLNAVTSATGLILFADIRSWGCMFFFGSLICSVFGGFIIPVLILMQSFRLFRLRGNNKTIGILAVMIPILTVPLVIGGLLQGERQHYPKYYSLIQQGAANQVNPVYLSSPPERLQVSGSVSTARNPRAGLHWWLEEEMKQYPRYKYTLKGLAEAISSQAGNGHTTIYEYSQRGEDLWVAGDYQSHYTLKGEEMTSYGFIWHSADNGKSWERQWSSKPGYPDPVYGIYFSDSHEGWALTLQTGILHTNDGGVSWEKVLECKGETIANLFIISKMRLLVSEGPPCLYIFSSEDRGSSWNKISVDSEKGQTLDQQLTDLKAHFGGGLVHYGGIYSNEGTDSK